MPPPTPAVDVAPLLDWLMAGADGNRLDPTAWVETLGRRVVAAGLPVSRLSLFVRPLHPNIATRAYYWREGSDAVEVGEEDHAFMGSEEHLASPIRHVISTVTPLRRRLDGPEAVLDYPVLTELRADNYTDYLLVPLEFLDGEVHAASFATRRPGGFTPAHVNALERIRPALTRVIEIVALGHKAGTLLDTYLGHHAGDKVLRGRIQRGDTESIDAVVWACDLRASTKLAEVLGPGGFLAMLNDYFEAVLVPVTTRGGEVLSFVGDGAIAMFPVENDFAGASTRAVEATRDAIARMAALNQRRVAAGSIPLRFGIGVHAGELLYGNVGAPSRITFTAVGTAANEVARIEALCKTLRVSPLVSAEVARHVPDAWRSLGVHALRGVGRAIELYTF